VHCINAAEAFPAPSPAVTFWAIDANRAVGIGIGNHVIVTLPVPLMAADNRILIADAARGVTNSFLVVDETNVTAWPVIYVNAESRKADVAVDHVLPPS
jgi:hypothetical protein